MKIYDCFMFNNELDLLEVRLKYLWDAVDFFVIVESDTTFSGKDKPLFFKENKEKFSWAKDKIRHVVFSPDRDKIDYESDTDEKSYHHESFRWDLEASQRNHIHEGFKDAEDEDLIIISDVDEFPKLEIIEKAKEMSDLDDDPILFNLLTHYYFFDCQGQTSENRWIKCLALCRHKAFNEKWKDAQDIRTRGRLEASSVLDNAGWHFSYLGGAHNIRQKIASFSHTEYDKDFYKDLARIENCLKEGIDVFGRNQHEYAFCDFFESDDYDDKLKNILIDYPVYFHTPHEDSTKEKKICLNMIVKDETAIIEKCINSVVDEIDCYVICDTGSSDDTKEKIKAIMDDKGIPGEIHDIEFKNFEYSRNKALELAQASNLEFDYILFDDADMELEVNDKDWKKGLKHDFYIIKQYNTIAYYNTRLIKKNAKAKYVGVTHEYIDCSGQRDRLDAIQYLDHACGSSRKEKFERDAKLLKEGLEEEREDSGLHTRYLFYLGQTYFDMGNVEEAIKWYKKRVEKGGWPEETFYSLYRMGIAYEILGKESDMAAAHLKAYNIRPSRIESLYELAKYHRIKENYHTGYMFAKMASITKYPKEDLLFVAKDVYDFKIWDELSICAYWVGSFKESLDICRKLLNYPNLPAGHKLRIKANLDFSNQKLHEK